MMIGTMHAVILNIVSLYLEDTSPCTQSFHIDAGGFLSDAMYYQL